MAGWRWEYGVDMKMGWGWDEEMKIEIWGGDGVIKIMRWGYDYGDEIKMEKWRWGWRWRWGMVIAI